MVLTTTVPVILGSIDSWPSHGHARQVMKQSLSGNYNQRQNNEDTTGNIGRQGMIVSPSFKIKKTYLKLMAIISNLKIKHGLFTFYILLEINEFLNVFFINFRFNNVFPIPDCPHRHMRVLHWESPFLCTSTTTLSLTTAKPLWNVLFFSRCNWRRRQEWQKNLECSQPSSLNTLRIVDSNSRISPLYGLILVANGSRFIRKVSLFRCHNAHLLSVCTWKFVVDTDWIHMGNKSIHHFGCCRTRYSSAQSK